MNPTAFLKRLLVLSGLGLALLMPAAHAQHSHATGPYTTVNPPQPSDTSGKIEVLEFFSYTCPHCKAMEPMVENWSKTLPDDVALVRVPVALNAGMAPFQRMYYTLETLGRLNDLHGAFFNALHTQKRPLYDLKSMAAWAAEQGVDRKEFESIFNSFGTDAKVSRANELAKAYRIDSTPNLAVGGRYVTSPTHTNSYEGTIAQAAKLLEQIRAGQPAAK